MTRRLPEGNTLRSFRDTLDDMRSIWPADRTERAADDFLRRSRARPVSPRVVPWIVPFLFGAAAMALAVALASFAVDAVQTGAAARVQAVEYAAW